MPIDIGTVCNQFRQKAEELVLLFSDSLIVHLGLTRMCTVIISDSCIVFFIKRQITLHIH